jgi:F0F1-type ATP synthase delta subunit
MAEILEKRMRALSIKLTDEQKKAIEKFWKETGSVGTVELQVDVVNDKISPASIQVGTAK